MKPFSIAFICLLALLLASCGGGAASAGAGGGGGGNTGGGGNATTVAVGAGTQFATFLQTSSGLNAAPGSPVRTTGTTTACASDTANAFVVAGYNNSTAVSYGINNDGSASTITNGFVSAQPNAMTELGGRFIYLAESNSGVNQIGGFSLSTSGVLVGIQNQLTNLPVVDLTAHPTASLLVASFNPASLQAFGVDNNGLLTPLGTLNNVGGSAQHSMAFMQNGAFLAIAEGTSPSFPVDLVTVNTTSGAITRVGSPVNVPGGAIFLAPHPGGRFVYAFGTTSVTPITVDANGVVTVGTAMQLTVTPTAAAVDKAGTTLYVGSSNGSLLAFSIDATTGILSAAPVATTTVGAAPVCIAPK